MVQVGQHVFVKSDGDWEKMPLPVVLTANSENPQVVVMDDGNPKVYLTALVQVVEFPVTSRQYVQYYIDRLDAYMASYPHEDERIFDWHRGAVDGLEKTLELLPEDEDD